LERLGGEYQFVTVPELLRHGRPQRQHWYRAPDLAYLNRLWTAQGEARRYPQPGARPAEKPQPRETTR
jgi:hypothetical protein